jgi:hypothetical protein
MAGTFVLASAALGYFVSPYFLIFTAFVGLNLLQSGFTNWCPAMWMLQKAGLRHGEHEAPPEVPGRPAHA